MAKLRLIESGSNKLQIIKLIRIYSLLDLKESKDIVDNVPSEFYIDQEHVNLQFVIHDFEKAGAKVIVANDQKTEISSNENQIKRYIKLISGSDDKIRLIALIREFSFLGLKECKDLIEIIPSVFELKSDEKLYNIRPRFTEIGSWIEEASEYEIGQFEIQNSANSSKKLEIEIVLAGKNQIEVIKLVQLYSGMGLSESKKIIDSIPSIFEVKNQKFNYNQIKKNFEEIGAIVNQTVETTEKYDSKEINEPSPGKAYGKVETTMQIENRLNSNPNQIKSTNHNSDSDDMLQKNQNQGIKKQNIKNALIFANVSAIVLSVFPISYFGIIFIIAYIIAHLLRKNNLPNMMLGQKSALLVLNYFIAKNFLLTLAYPIIEGRPNEANLNLFINSVFNSSSLSLVLAAVISYFLASNKRFLKNRYKGNDLTFN